MKKSMMLTVLVILLAVPIGVKAWGVSYENNEITLNIGESKLFYTNIQNMEGDTKNITVVIDGERGIQSNTILGDEFLILQPKTKTTYYINITAVEPGTHKLTVYYTSNPIGSGLTITTRKSLIITVNVRENDPETVHVPFPGRSAGDGNIPSGTNGILYPETQDENVSEQNNETEIQYHEENTINDDDAPILDETSGRGVGVTMGTSAEGNPIMMTIIIVIVLSVIGFIVYKKDIIGKLDWI
jgi:hypothetical protein